MSTLDQRLTRLEDLAAIQELTARYAHAINHGYAGKTLDTEAVREIFTPGARWHSDGFGTTIGAEATAAVTFAMHAFLNPVINLDTDTATGTWPLWVASVIADTPARSTWPPNSPTPAPPRAGASTASRSIPGSPSRPRPTDPMQDPQPAVPRAHAA
ncbi:nuclear transport factor 2 family protein [Nocardia otitidiscaviarum]|uniref:nuclear transport factor 2 family protein n=1 Tax=Nocardia otitidiscaviarum TaxID=1823 RepID=UPI001893B593|nr:nuclear transport factor 2 family protein [Nocardia otitidiscaviarum]MBF6180736.1 nuclear transport factor 2 family protein [Nocardia otitidiscaviarum]